ncbi:MAG: hypothetical protein M0R17_06805 [Candidatus Omnitrophica bacterium]|jgi:hypothetical protein|nr:hypothetical protein [Candidatus Omnitrophota bacterium]
MKTLIFIIITCLALFAGFYNGYCEDASSSGVIVIGSSETSSSETQSSNVLSSDSGDSSVAEPAASIPVPLYEISGSKIGSTRVSQGVTLPSAGEVMFVDAGISGAFTLVRVEAGGKEMQVLNMSPERSVGHKLAKGTYRAYPEDPDGRFPLDKLSVMVQVKLIESAKGGEQ